MLETPVLIAGGGPVGMTLALELARYGVASTLVERNPTTTRHPKMDITNGRSMELFRRLGVVEDLRAAGVPAGNVFDVAYVTSLSGHELHRFRYASPRDLKDAIRKRNDGSQSSEPPLRVSQVVIEPILKAKIDASPLVDVRFGTEFRQLVDQDGDQVVSEVVEVATGHKYRVRSRYLAGCDGGSSAVRRDIGIKTDGQYDAARAYMVHFHSEDRKLLQRWGTTWHYQTLTGSMIAQNDKDTWTLHAWILPGMDEKQMKPERILEEWAGRKFEYRILQANPWGAHLVVAEKYVSGRVALAGDAAHQFIPTGGYGMNSGIGDAAGLGWVLAAGVQGWGGPNLLKGYEWERRMVARNCLAASGRHMAVRGQIAELYAQGGELQGDTPEAAARRTQLAQAIERIGNAENESWGVELGYRYDDSPIVACEAGAPPVDPVTYSGSTWPGGRLPHFYLEDGRSVHDLLGPYFTLLTLGEIDTSRLEKAVQARNLPLEICRLSSNLARSLLDRSLLLVRPDQHIAWRGDAIPEAIDELLAKVAGWA